MYWLARCARAVVRTDARAPEAHAARAEGQHRGDDLETLHELQFLHASRLGRPCASAASSCIAPGCIASLVRQVGGPPRGTPPFPKSGRVPSRVRGSVDVDPRCHMQAPVETQVHAHMHAHKRTRMRL